MTDEPAAVAGPQGDHRQVIRPHSRWRSIDFAELWRYRAVFAALTRRDLTLRYRQTFLGPAWVVLQPLIGATIFAAVFGGVVHLHSGGAPYFLFAYAGLLAWNPFSNLITSLTSSLVQNLSLVSKVYFPRLALPLAQVGSKLFDFGVGLVVFLVAAAAYSFPLTWRLGTIPAWLLLALALALGPGLALAALNVSYRDVGAVVPVVVPMLLYASPIAYGAGEVPHRIRVIYDLNPLVGLVDGFRWALLADGPLDIGAAAYSVGFAAAALILGAFFFRVREHRFADEL